MADSVSGCMYLLHVLKRYIYIYIYVNHAARLIYHTLKQNE